MRRKQDLCNNDENDWWTFYQRERVKKSLQLGTSSRAIHGGAYFSAVSGRKFNLTTVLRPCRPLACCWMFLFPPSVTFVLDFTELPSPMGLALYFQVDLSPKRLDGFLSNHTDCISPNRPWLHLLLHEAVFNDAHALMLGRQAFHYPICCNSITIRKIINSKLILLPNSQLGHVPSFTPPHFCHPPAWWLCAPWLMMFLKAPIGRPQYHKQSLSFQ